MKRLAYSVIWGVLITCMLVVITLGIGSEKLGCILLWQICLLDSLMGHPADRELPMSTIIGILVGIPIYASLVYLFLRKRKLRDEK